MSTPRTHEQLHTWIKDNLDITLSRSSRIDGHRAHFDYICHSFFVDSIKGGPSPTSKPLDAVVLAPRGGGKTFLGALATTLDLVHKPGIQIRILAGSQDQGTRMLAYLRQFFSLPKLVSLVDGSTTFGCVKSSGDFAYTKKYSWQFFIFAWLSKLPSVRHTKVASRLLAPNISSINKRR